VIGGGLNLNSGTLSASGFNLETLPLQTSLSPTDQMIVTNAGTLQFVVVDNVRALFTAGSNITIDASGVISAPSLGAAWTGGFAELPSVASLASGDLIAVSQNNQNCTITYGNLLEGETIDLAQEAGPASDGDTFWTAQTTNIMVRQTMGALWPWVSQKLPLWYRPVIEVNGNTTLEGAVHNNALVVCSSPLLITAVTANLASGFYCDLINACSGPVTFSGNILTSNGSSGLLSNQCASVYCVTYSAGTVVVASISAGSLATTAPGQASGLAASALTSTSLTLSWSAPTSGGSVSMYSVQFRVTGTTPWLSAGQTNGSPTISIGGLQATTSYDFTVTAANNIGTGPTSPTLSLTTSASNLLPGAPTAVIVTNITTNSMTCSWTAPTVGGSGLVYEVQYNTVGQTTWNTAASSLSATTLSLNNLASGTTYQIQITAANNSGSGSPSTITTAQTAQAAGLVASITWALVPTGSYPRGVGAIGVNAHVNPEATQIQFGFSQSSISPPALWTAGVHVNSDLWGQYVPTPATAGTWYAWAEGSDGSAPTAYATPFAVT
jgi:hypothetical protein